MSELEMLEMKKQLKDMSEAERREISAFLIRLRHETPEWIEEQLRRLDDMAKGEKTSAKELRKQLGL